MTSNVVEAAETPRRRVGRSRRGRGWWIAAALGVLAVVAGVKQFASVGASSPGDVPARKASGSQPARVEVVHPQKGGIERTTTQPGSVHSFETVDLFAMVSGYLKAQGVDIGSRVKKGDVLAEIDVPREASAAAEAEALLEQARSRARQAEARVKAMEAAHETTKAAVAQAVGDVDRLVAGLRLAESQYARVKDLSDRKAVDVRLVDEQRRDLETAVAAEKTGRLAVETAKSKVAEAAANIEGAKADVAEARAAVDVAESRLAKARVDLGYAKIVAPFDGVITRRNYHVGSFIRDASGSSALPVLTVSRTDLMRVVVRVPDRDVVLADAGDDAVVTIDGLEGRPFEGTVSRVGESEDHTTRTMRIEIDLPNPDGLLREGMYGKAKIALEPPSDRLTVPAACVLDRPGKGRGLIQVVRDGKVDRVTVQIGADDGKRVEVVSGVGPKDQVVLRSSTVLEPGSPVLAENAG
jgi:RND family efflux transporter MFP subunit